MQQSVKAEVIYGQTDVYLRKSSCPTIKKNISRYQYQICVYYNCPLLAASKSFFTIKIQYIKTDTV